MICENCGKEHGGSYGSGRFCSCKCARGFSTKENREEINRRVSKSLKGDGVPRSLGGKGLSGDFVKERSHASYERKVVLTSIKDLSKRTASKIFKRMELSCSRCGWDEDVCDIHHIIPKKDGGTDDHRNLTYICPNCHRLAGNGKIDPKTLISFWDYVGDEWKKYYFCKSCVMEPVGQGEVATVVPWSS